MSIELLSRFEPPLSPETIEKIRCAVLDIGNCLVVRDAGAEIGLQCWAWEAKTPVEQVTVVIERQQCYLAFHVATRDEQSKLKRAFEDAFKSLGVICEFQEI